MPLPDLNTAGRFADPVRAERLYRAALRRAAEHGDDERVDSLARDLRAAIEQQERKPWLCRLLGCGAEARQR